MDPQRRQVPVLTHLLTASAVGPGLLLLVLADLGMEPGGASWETGDGGWLVTLTVVVLTAGGLAALVEALLVRFLPWRWPVRLLGAAVVVVAALVASFPMTFSLTGAAGPVEQNDVTLYVLGFGLLVVGHLALTMLFAALLDVLGRPFTRRAT